MRPCMHRLAVVRVCLYPLYVSLPSAPTEFSVPTAMTAARFLPSGTEFDIVTKAIIIGDSSVGKSSLLYRYTDSDWNPHYIATIGVDFKVLTFERESKVVKLQLWDTAGQDRFKTITHTYYRGSHGVMVVFDLTNHQSFENVTRWLEEFHQFGGVDVPVVLVGNKADLPNHAVSKAEAEALATQIGCKYISCSAKDDSAVDEAFRALTDRCIAHRMKQIGGGGRRKVGDEDIRRPVGRNTTTPKAAGGCPCS